MELDDAVYGFYRLVQFPPVQGWPVERDLVKSIYYDGVVHWPTQLIDIEPVPLLGPDPSDPPYHRWSPHTGFLAGAPGCEPY